MNDFGPKRPMSEDALCVSDGIEKAKHGRPKEKPDYDRDKEIEAFQAKSVQVFGGEISDRVERTLQEEVEKLDEQALTEFGRKICSTMRWR